MANEEHLRILREGVDRWNQWREAYSQIVPNLSGADLREVKLIRINFSGAILREAVFREADLSKANFTRANLNEANFSKANLYMAELLEADLIRTNLFMTDLSRANFTRANLGGANLSDANLSDANLKDAMLFMAKLTDANLNRANLSDANLHKCILSRTQALGTNFRNAVLTEACIEDWHINNSTQLSSVICEYIFLKSKQQERRPSDHNKIFASGDFARLVQKGLETVDLIFSNGIDWKAFAISLEDLRVQYGEQDLSIQAIENKNDAFVIRLNVPPDADKGAIERQAMQLYETRLVVLEAQYRSQLQAKDEQIAIYREQSTNMTEIVKLLANRPIDVKAIAMAENKPTENYSNDLRGANIANYANKLDGNARQQAKQYNYTAEQKQTLAEAAADIQQLLEQLSQTYPTTTQAEKIVVAAKAAEEIEQNPALRSRVIGALKAGGVEALKELVDHPLVTILLAALEGWQKPE